MNRMPSARPGAGGDARDADVRPGDGEAAGRQGNVQPRRHRQVLRGAEVTGANRRPRHDAQRPEDGATVERGSVAAQP